MRYLQLVVWLGVVAFSACNAEMRVNTAAGSATSLTEFATFALIDEDLESDSEPLSSPEGLKARLQKEIAKSLEAHGYRRAPLKQAHFAVSIDTGFLTVTEPAVLTGNRSVYGMGTRQQQGTREVDTEMAVALDFVDLRGRQVVWRITANGALPSDVQATALVRSLMDLVDTAPALQLSEGAD